MAKSKRKRYWDSCCFLGFLAREPDKFEKCEAVLKTAEKGGLLIVTSALTLAEVIKLKKKASLPPDRSDEIQRFFQNDWLELRNVSPALAAEARDLIWNHGIDSKDAIHVATALSLHLTQMDTFDTALHKKSSNLGDPPLAISVPDLPLQLDFDDAVSHPG